MQQHINNVAMTYQDFLDKAASRHKAAEARIEADPHGDKSFTRPPYYSYFTVEELRAERELILQTEDRQVLALLFRVDSILAYLHDATDFLP